MFILKTMMTQYSLIFLMSFLRKHNILKWISVVCYFLHRHSTCRHSRSGRMPPLPGPKLDTALPQYLGYLVYPPGPSSSRGKWSQSYPHTGTRIPHNMFTIMPQPPPTVQTVLFAIADVPFNNFASVLRKRKSCTNLHDIVCNLQYAICMLERMWTQKI